MFVAATCSRGFSALHACSYNAIVSSFLVLLFPWLALVVFSLVIFNILCMPGIAANPGDPVIIAINSIGLPVSQSFQRVAKKSLSIRYLNNFVYIFNFAMMSYWILKNSYGIYHDIWKE